MNSYEADLSALFPGFTLAHIDTGAATLRVRHGGSGPPLLLLHGHPQTHAMWYKVAPLLAHDFTVVCPDLRGYGESSKPPTDDDHAPYSKRAMARDMVALMQGLGFDKWAVAGHDRGGYVAYRLAIEYPEQIEKLAVLDIIPAGEALRRANVEFARGYWHWFFLSQPAPFPETLIGADPDYFYRYRQPQDPAQFFDPAIFADFRRAWHDPATVSAMCEDYRANVTIDYALDEADRGNRRISCPVLALWSARDELQQWYDVLAIWSAWAADVGGGPINSGHHLAAEAPAETYAALHNFFSR